MPNGCESDPGYTMNTVQNAQNYSNTSGYPYDSNGATDATAGRHLVTLSGRPAQVSFNPNVQWRTVNCCEQSCAAGSDDWEYCALNSLAAWEFEGENEFVRRFNDRPNHRVEFQAEAFNVRYHPRSNHYWWCQTYQSSSGWTGKCFMKAEPNDGTNLDTNYATTSPELQYRVPFPQSAPTRYYIWIRGRGCSGSDDSVHVGLDGQPVATASRMSG